MNRPTVQLDVQQLENRDVPATVSLIPNVALGGWIAKVTCDARADVVRSFNSDDIFTHNLKLEVNGAVYRLPDVSKVLVNFGNGANVLDNYHDNMLFEVNDGGHGSFINLGQQNVSGVPRFENIVRGNGGNDTIRGTQGKDKLFGGAGNDKMFGLAGDDELYSQGGADRLDGGAGHDLLQGSNSPDILIGGQGADRMLSLGGRDVIQRTQFDSTDQNRYDTVLQDNPNIEATDALFNLASREVVLSQVLPVDTDINVYDQGENVFIKTNHAGVIGAYPNVAYDKVKYFGSEANERIVVDSAFAELDATMRGGNDSGQFGARGGWFRGNEGDDYLDATKAERPVTANGGMGFDTGDFTNGHAETAVGGFEVLRGDALAQIFDAPGDRFFIQSDSVTLTRFDSDIGIAFTNPFDPSDTQEYYIVNNLMGTVAPLHLKVRSFDRSDPAWAAWLDLIDQGLITIEEAPTEGI